MLAISAVLVLVLGSTAKLIENESFVRRQLRTFTTVTPQIPQPAAVNVTVTVPTTPAAVPVRSTLPPQLVATTPGLLSYADMANRSRPILLAPQHRIDGEDDAVEPKYFYTQPHDHSPSDAASAAVGADPGNRHYIDYRKVYGIRYRPHTIRRSFALSSEQQPSQADSAVDDAATDAADEAFPVLDDVVGDAGAADNLSALPDSTLSVDEALSAAQVVTDTAEEPTEVEMTTEMPPPLTGNESENEIPTETSVTSTATPTDPPTTPTTTAINVAASSNVMTPSRVHSTLQFIKQRVQALLANGLYTGPQDSSGQRFLSLFNVIKFANEPCSTDAEPLQSLNGTCYNQQECDELGGVALGECANGFGVCCVCE